MGSSTTTAATVKNGTPHKITIVDDAGRVVHEIPTSEVIRCAVSTAHVGTLVVGDVTIPVTSSVYGEANLPPVEDGVFWVVSALVRAAHPERDDLLVPADLVRDEEGAIIGCRSLGR